MKKYIYFDISLRYRCYYPYWSRDSVSPVWRNFHRLGPLGRNGLVVSMFVRTYVFNFFNFFWALLLALRSNDQIPASHCSTPQIPAYHSDITVTAQHLLLIPQKCCKFARVSICNISRVPAWLPYSAPSVQSPISVPTHAALHCTPLQCTELHCNALHYTYLHCTVIHCTVLQWAELQCTTLHCNALHSSDSFLSVI